MSGPLAVTPWLAAAFLAGCDFFATKDFSPKPTEIRAFADAFEGGDTVAFRMTESLAEPGSATADTVLVRRQLRFSRAADSLQPGDGWTAVSVRVLSDPPGDYLDEGVCWLRFDAAGLVLRNPDTSAGGARYYPLKVASGAGPARKAPASGSAPAAPAALTAPADTGEFLALPPVFATGTSWVQAMGVLEVDREIEETDTLSVGNRLEESWRVAETVRDGVRTLARGRFWYGASGLLKGEQVWAFEVRAADGSPMPARELRRNVERL